MKIFTQCECLLLSQSLRIFLGEFWASKKECDFIVSDAKFQSEKPVFVLGENLEIPFSRAELIAAINEFWASEQEKERKKIKNLAEEKIANLIDNFKFDLINLLRNLENEKSQI